jgi:hypothetical protein
VAHEKRWGLRLVLPGAPNTAHTVPGVTGYFYPDAPTPVGAEGELPLEAAKEYDADKGCPLELIEIKPSEVEDAEQLAVDSVKEGRKGLQAAHQDGFKGAEKARAKDEADAQKEVN